ncbi:MAG TPA: LacI family DNA-binding transcriptional regulator [Jiangellaceae bacterium]
MSAPTIYDVAREAGVAASTVSRAFNNPNRVRDSTRDHILSVAGKLGYQHNPHARALLSGRTHAIGMVVSDITNPHYFELIRGAEQRVKASKYTLVLVNAGESPRIEYDHIRRLAQSVDGFVLAASRLPDENILEFAGMRPLVLMNRELPGLPSVIVDYAEGCRRIVDHLASFGHQSVVYLAGPRNSWTAQQRWRSIRQACEKIGIEAERIGYFIPTVPSGVAAADAALHTDTTAVIAHNDLLAIGVLRRLAERGVSVPADMSVVGFDNIFAADLCTPALTTLGGAHAEVGGAAVELLLDRTRVIGAPSDAEPHLILPSWLHVRASTGPASRGNQSH